MARKKEAHGGGHGWFVTFADLMGLLVSFFVMLVAFSSQDSKKVAAVAGSMRDAFGVQREARVSGVMEIDGIPTRHLLKYAARIPPEYSSITPGPDQQGEGLNNASSLAQAAVSLRQALQEFPELTEASKRISFEETTEGLNIELVNQDGASMFPKGSRIPNERTRLIIEKLAGPLKMIPYRLSITGHAAGKEVDPAESWKLAIDRANAIRQILEEEGYPSANFFKVAAKAANEPMFPEDSTLPPNRRVTITLMREAPPVPADLRP
jgi:chemotaxis protein MotB